jgi:hypothetical protein
MPPCRSGTFAGCPGGRVSRARTPKAQGLLLREAVLPCSIGRATWPRGARRTPVDGFSLVVKFEDVGEDGEAGLHLGYVYKIAATSLRKIFMAGHAISLEVTTDGGRTWHFARRPPGGRYSDTYQVQFFNQAAGFIFGIDLNANRVRPSHPLTQGVSGLAI